MLFYFQPSPTRGAILNLIRRVHTYLDYHTPFHMHGINEVYTSNVVGERQTDRQTETETENLDIGF